MMQKSGKMMLAAVLLIGFAAVKLGALYWWQGKQAKVQEISACNVHQGCVLPNGVEVKFSDTVAAKAPFEIVLRNVPDHIQEVTVSFSMKNMDMGFNRYRLTDKGNGVWSAEQIRLPVCVQNRSDYLADLSVGGAVFQTAFTAK